MTSTNAAIGWWDSLRHFGLLLSPSEVARLDRDHRPDALPRFRADQLRRELNRRDAGEISAPDFAAWVLFHMCGFDRTSGGEWKRGSDVPSDYSHPLLTGETLKPRQLWIGRHGGLLPVFLDSAPTLGLGRGRKTIGDVLQWLRRARQPLAVITNARQWRLIFAGLDYDATCEWDTDLWFEEGAPGVQLDALRLLLQSALIDPPSNDESAALHAAILASRRGQAELSAVLGERVREAVEALVRAHGPALDAAALRVAGADIYRAAVRIVMRMVVVLFAESRELLPRANPVYHGAYGLQGLFESLQKIAVRGRGRLEQRFGAWPRVLGLFRLIHAGSHHEALQVPDYGGELFAPGQADAQDPVSRALHVFESACFDTRFELMPDAIVQRMLELLTRTKVRVRQGRSTTLTTVPVDFSDLSSEYIGILYEGLLDYELRTAPQDEPIVFLAVGDEPALPLSRLEAMDDKQVCELFEKLKERSADDGEDEPAVDEPLDPESGAPGDAAASEAAEQEDEEPPDDDPVAVAAEHSTADAARGRALAWTQKACLAAKLLNKPRGRLTPEKEKAFQARVESKARQLVRRVVLPGEWYLVRWGGTRKGSGTFYTRPQLAVPTVYRTLRPLACDAPVGAGGSPDLDAPAPRWEPKKPEEILALKVCDPACGSGSFLVATLRYLTDTVYASLFAHDRLAGDESWRRPLDEILGLAGAAGREDNLHAQRLPCRPQDDDFEPRTKALLRRYVVERCIYGVDIDPLAVELCRLALWVETMDRDLPFSFLDHKIKCGNSLVGCWFDQFRHYPAMAWKNREGGDKGHTGGVHFAKEVRTKAIKEFVRKELQPDLADFIRGQQTFAGASPEDAARVHDQALAVLSRLHDLPVHHAADRCRVYREEFLGSASWQSLKTAFDLWCACWFWPAGRLEDAPLPSRLAAPSEATSRIAADIAAKHRFFHWELEFPDVFDEPGSGFGAIVGNPPWETLQPNSKEFFSNIDPLYRSYGKQHALGRQTLYFENRDIERSWLDYNSGYSDNANWMKFAVDPFGDPGATDDGQDRFSLGRGRESAKLHELWRETRVRDVSYADLMHPYRHRGEGKAYTYKLFLELGHSLLRNSGRLGFIVPSGLYSDHGTGALRKLFLERCRWEWLFGFENREGIFDIHRSYKFNPVIVEKGGCTEAIRTAFMRRRLEDWENAEQHATLYASERVTRFSPKSRAILEIQSQRDLEILEKIYANSVLLGDDGPDGWGIKYAQGDFNMTSDSKLFPPRPQWEEKGYKPDEYSRWLLGAWQPIDRLWAELGIDPSRPRPLDPAAEAALAAAAGAGNVQRTQWKLRCAQPPYDGLPIPRADISAGIILSRDASKWIREESVEDVALPLYQGIIVGNLDPNCAAWQSGTGLSAKWNSTDPHSYCFDPQFLLSVSNFLLDDSCAESTIRYAFRDIARSTERKTMIGSIVAPFPCGNTVPTLSSHLCPTFAAGVLSSWVYDWTVRFRLGGTHLNYYVIAESPLCNPTSIIATAVSRATRRLCMRCFVFSVQWLRVVGKHGRQPIRRLWAVSDWLRTSLRCQIDALVALQFGLDLLDLSKLLGDCDHPTKQLSAGTFRNRLDQKGFWRADRELDPELRHTVLTLVAFHDLQQKIEDCSGDRDRGIEAFCNQNDGEGWMLPETLRLADYGLGHDDRAKEHQPIASRLGPRFYDWQLAQDAEESWRECKLHARNLLGAAGFQQLMREIEAQRRGQEGRPTAQPEQRSAAREPATPPAADPQPTLF